MDTLTLGHLLAFNLAVFIAVASPGPAFLICTQASLQGGRRAGVMTGFGLAFVAGLWTLAALLGLDVLFQAYPSIYGIMTLGGAGLILLFAVGAWITADRPLADAPQMSQRRAFLQGLALNLANPKSILFAAGVLLVIFPSGLSHAEMAVITLNHIALEVAVYATLAWLLNRPTVRARYIAFKPRLMRVMAGVLALLAVRLLVWS